MTAVFASPPYNKVWPHATDSGEKLQNLSKEITHSLLSRLYQQWRYGSFWTTTRALPPSREAFCHERSAGRKERKARFSVLGQFYVGLVSLSARKAVTQNGRRSRILERRIVEIAPILASHDTLDLNAVV